VYRPLIVCCDSRYYTIEQSHYQGLNADDVNQIKRLSRVDQVTHMGKAFFVVQKVEADHYKK